MSIRSKPLHSIPILGLALLVACSEGNKQLSRTDVQLAAGDLRTFAYSTELLIEECSAGDATSTFCEQQAGFLSSKLDDVTSELDGQAPDAELERKQLADIVTSLHDTATGLKRGSTGPRDAADAGHWGAICKNIEESLRK